MPFGGPIYFAVGGTLAFFFLPFMCGHLRGTLAGKIATEHPRTVTFYFHILFTYIKR